MRLVSIGTIMALCTGCGTAATVHRWGAPSLEAEIVDSDSKNIYVEDDQARRYRVPRSHITQIDHPGNVALGIGLGLLAVGAMMYFVDDDAGQESDDARRTLGLVYALPGAVLTGWGGYSWFGSTSAASHMGAEEAMPMPSVVPVGVADVVLPPGVLPAPKAAGAAESPAPAPGTPEAFAPSETPPAGSYP